MKNKIIVLITVLIATISSAQNGINYKAIVKDGSGNLITNDLIQVNFKILQGAAQTSIYEETHSQSTDADGLIVLNIGDGTVISGDFTTIDWASDDTFLNVQINTGAGLVDLGTTAFSTVPYALHAQTATTADNVTGLEAIDEGNGIGWRLSGRAPSNYGNIGLNAIDLSYSINTTSTPNNGATGVNSTTIGNKTTASGAGSFAIGKETVASGYNSMASGLRSVASGIMSVAMGADTEASGSYATAIGAATVASGQISTAMGDNTVASGDLSTSMGESTTAPSFAEMAIGQFNTNYTPNSTDSWNVNDRLFVIGNGTSSNGNDALTVLKNGQHTINSDDDGLVVNAGSTSFDDGIYVSFAGDDGIQIQSAGDIGVAVNDAGRYGGGFVGDESGVYAESSNDANPDVILGGTFGGTASDDDGIISSDPAYTGSDIFLRSNDAVVVQLDFDNNEAGQFEIKDGNQVEVFEVDESGNVRVNGSLVHTSDRRLKKDITDLTYGLEEILQLQPKAYNWKDREQEHKSLGLIAQDVQPIIKEIVNAKDDPEKTLGISYKELIPVLINAIKEQNKRIDELEARLDSQETNVVARKD